MYVHVTVTAGAKKETVKKLKDAHLTISVREPALRNMANKRVLELVAGYFGLSKGKARIVSGHHSPSKIVRID